MPEVLNALVAFVAEQLRRPGRRRRRYARLAGLLLRGPGRPPSKCVSPGGCRGWLPQV